MAARRRYMNLRENRTGLSVETRRSIMRGSTGDLTVVAIHTECLINQEHVRCFSQPLVQKKVEHRPGFGMSLELDILSEALAHLRR